MWKVIVIIILFFLLLSAVKNPEGSVPKAVNWFYDFIAGFFNETQLPNTLLRNTSSTAQTFINGSNP